MNHQAKNVKQVDDFTGSNLADRLNVHVLRRFVYSC